MYYVYILTNKNKTTLYVGVTNDLVRRVYEHKNEFVEGFTKRYNVCDLVYYEEFSDINYAITREKQLKSKTRNKKEMLINAFNPSWKDLYYEIV